MIKFFRKIRQKLLSQSSFRKYLLYALGEIILVVLGILIALQINNWNEIRKNRIEEQGILSNLKIEFSANQQLLEGIIDEHSDMAIRLRRLSALIRPNPEPLKIEALDSLMFAVINNPVYKPVNNTLSTLTSSGNLEKIKNKQVRDLIFNWENCLDNYNNSIKYTTDHYFAYTSQFIIQNYQIKNFGLEISRENVIPSAFEIDPKSILSDAEFENYVELRRANAEQQLNLSNQLYDIQEAIINSIR